MLIKGQAKDFLYAKGINQSRDNRVSNDHWRWYIDTVSLQCTCSSRLGEEAEKVGAWILDLFPWGPWPDSDRRKEGEEVGKRGEFMCLGRVKGTRVATSAANGRRTAADAASTSRRRGARGNGCTCASRALSRQIPFSGSFPTARARRGGPFSGPGDRESAASPKSEKAIIGETRNPSTHREIPYRGVDCRIL